MRTATAGERIARTYARALVAGRWLVVGLWIAASVAAALFLPGLSSGSGDPLTDIVPQDATALITQERALERFGATLATDSVVVQRDPRGLKPEQVEKTVDVAQKPTPGVKAAVPIANVPLPGVRWGEKTTTVVTYLFMDQELNLLERERAAQTFADRLGPPAARVSGAGPARLGQFRAIQDKLPIITGATVLLIFVIVAVYFRSLLAPFVTLLTAGIGYVLALRILAWSAERAGTAAPAEIEPVLVVLLLGLVTDYTMFFMSEQRRGMRNGLDRLEAARRATVRIAPIVAMAGMLVAGGAAALLAGELEFFRVFGPGLAVASIVVTLVCVTLVPACIAIGGERLFGGVAREAKRQSRMPQLAGLNRLLAGRPAATALALLCVATLVVAALQGTRSEMTVSFIPSLPDTSEARLAAQDAGRGFAPGVLAPTDVIVEHPELRSRAPQLAKLQDLIAGQPGVAGVIGPGQVPDEGLRKAVVAEDGGAARYLLFLDQEPTSAEAIADLRALQTRIPALAVQAGLAPTARISYGGETALAAETVDALVEDLWRVGVAIFIVTLVLLALFLRALLAPLLLLFGSALAFAGAFGLTTLLAPHLLGSDDFVYYVPLVAAVLLIGLGSDYNVLVAGRIREEARRRRMRDAVAVGAPAASRAITAAGITLAATFALLAIVPLRPFRELALLLAVGVLVDALVVRPVLIPSLLAMADRVAWWPSRPRCRIDRAAFVQDVAQRSDRTSADAEVMAQVTLGTLAQRLPASEVSELTAYLGDDLMTLFAEPGPKEDFDAHAFLVRVAERAGVPIEVAGDDARAVLAALAEALTAEELAALRRHLDEDYDALFDPFRGAPVPVAG